MMASIFFDGELNAWIFDVIEALKGQRSESQKYKVIKKALETLPVAEMTFERFKNMQKALKELRNES